MTDPKLDLPESVESAIKDLVIASTRVLTSEQEKAAQIVLLKELLAALRREIKAAFLERDAEWAEGLRNETEATSLRAQAAAIRKESK